MIGKAISFSPVSRCKFKKQKNHPVSFEAHNWLSKSQKKEKLNHDDVTLENQNHFGKQNIKFYMPNGKGPLNEHFTFQKLRKL